MPKLHDPLLFCRQAQRHTAYHRPFTAAERWLWWLLLSFSCLALLLLGCVRQQPHPRSYRSHAQYLRSSAIRQREADAERNAARDAQRRVSSQPTTQY